MHILVTNDDGPPSPTSSPYVHSLVRALQRAGHVVSVCLPHTQRSWIGKAHMIGETVKPTYYRPSATFDPTPRSDSDRPSTTPQGTTHTRPVKSPGVEEWILVDGTPASCAQIGLHHFFAEKGPIDLVVSGPNYGRNTTAVFALSSGTLGGALEAAVCKKKAIALSYAFFSRNHDPAIIEGASAHSVKVIESLYKQWPGDGSVDVYTVNVPLVEGVGEHKTIFTAMLQNYWGSGSCFQEVEGSVGDEGEEESRIREGEGQSEVQPAAGGQDDSTGYPHRHFKWAPRFTDVYQSVENAPPGNDGWAVKEGLTSITPMKANFWHAATELHGQELKLDTKNTQQTGAIGHGELSLPRRPKNHFYALVAYEDPYVQPLILSALAKVMPPESYTLLDVPSASTASSAHAQPDIDAPSEISLPSLLPAGAASDTRILQITPYEQVDWSYVADHDETVLVNSYMLRKALIRKHYLGATIEGWVAKRPDSILKTHFKRGEAFEVDYAEFLDDALVEAFDLRASLEQNEGKEEAKDREWWILKPGMSDRGQGIRLFSTMEELQAIFDGWEEDMPDSDEEEDDEDGEAQAATENGKGAGDDDGGDYITTSHLRHFVAQPYLHPPLLLAGHGNRKFHIRTYVACVGSMDVYVYREMLALFAGKPYAAPWETAGGGGGEGRADVDLEAHLTNTCLQRSVQDGSVRRFWDIDLPDRHDAAASPATTGAAKEDLFEQICAVTGEVFEAAARGMLMHFQPLPNAFEIFGLDFLVDAAGRAWLLEVNSFPDFKQTGADLQGLVAELWEGVLRLAVRRRFTGEAGEGRQHAAQKSEGGVADSMVHVRHVDLGRRFG